MGFCVTNRYRGQLQRRVTVLLRSRAGIWSPALPVLSCAFSLLPEAWFFAFLHRQALWTYLLSLASTEMHCGILLRWRVCFNLTLQTHADSISPYHPDWLRPGLCRDLLSTLHLRPVCPHSSTSRSNQHDLLTTEQATLLLKTPHWSPTAFRIISSLPRAVHHVPEEVAPGPLSDLTSPHCLDLPQHSAHFCLSIWSVPRCCYNQLPRGRWRKTTHINYWRSEVQSGSHWAEFQVTLDGST